MLRRSRMHLQRTTIVSRLSDLSRLICFFCNTVPDEVVIDVVKAKITACEKECRHWLIDGFPRTKVQALSLEQIGVIPDKMIALHNSDERAIAKIKQSLAAKNQGNA